MTRTQLEREFQERRRIERRAAINAGIVALHERRAIERRNANSRIAEWMRRFDRARVNVAKPAAREN